MSKIFEDLKKDINNRINKMSEKEKNNPSSNTYESPSTIIVKILLYGFGFFIFVLFLIYIFSKNPIAGVGLVIGGSVIALVIWISWRSKKDGMTASQRLAKTELELAQKRKLSDEEKKNIRIIIDEQYNKSALLMEKAKTSVEKYDIWKDYDKVIRKYRQKVDIELYEYIEYKNKKLSDIKRANKTDDN